MNIYGFISYLDDGAIVSATFEQHIASLERVFRRLDDAGITLGAKKTLMAKPEMNFLGHIVNNEGIHPDPKKLLAVQHMKLPESLKEMRAAMGLLSYYRKYVKDYAKVTNSLRKMQNDAERWRKAPEFSEVEKAAFNKVKSILLSDAVLNHPDWNEKFEVQTDASLDGLGAVLCQRVNDRECVIAFASRSLTKAEKGYSVPELEALAMIWSTRVFRLYLTGKKFTFVTDSRAAQFIMTNESEGAAARVLKFRLALQSYEYDIRHRSASSNGPADYLSRYPIGEEEPYSEGPIQLNMVKEQQEDSQQGKEASTPKQEAQMQPVKIREGNDAFFPPLDLSATTTEQWQIAQTLDEYCSTIIAKLKAKSVPNDRVHERFTMSDNLLFKIVNNNPVDGEGLIKGPDSRRRSRNKQLVVPMTLRHQVMHQYHTLPVAGHAGRHKVEDSIRTQYYWSGMQKDLKRYIAACHVCNTRKTPRPKYAGMPAVVTQARRPHHTLSIDLVSATEEDNTGHKYILTILDIFTRYIITVPLRTKKAREIADSLFERVFAIKGRPIRIQTDQGSEFVNAGLERMYKTWGIQSVATGGYQPQATPVERYHKFLNHCMTALATAYGGAWTTYLPAATFVYNASVCASTGYAPYQLNFGHDPTMLQDLDFLVKDKDNGQEGEEEDYYTSTAKRMVRVYEQVRRQQQKISDKNVEARSAKAINVKYDIKDLVLLWEPAQPKRFTSKEGDDVNMQKARMAPKKWIPTWTGPHEIVEVVPAGGLGGYRYIILHQRRGERIQVHPNKLHLFNPWSKEQPTTAPEMKSSLPFMVGSNAPVGALFAVALLKPWPLGIGEVLHTDAEGKIAYRWYGNGGTGLTLPFRKGWTKRDSTIYYSSNKDGSEDQPYYGTDLEVNQRDILCHSFQLTTAGHLPTPVINFIRNHADTWYGK